MRSRRSARVRSEATAKGERNVDRGRRDSSPVEPRERRREMTRTISLAGATLELIERGQGRSLLFLHAGEGLAPERPWLDLFAKRYCVIAPSHPGYGNSPLIDGGADGVDDLAYLYLDLVAELGLEDAVLVGADLGGWIAAEMMGALDRPVLPPGSGRPLGIK